jgi:ribosome-binding protein aMBF1 (putative translation factor)
MISYIPFWHITNWNISYRYMKNDIYSNNHKFLAQQLKKAREEAGLDQKEVADFLGKTQSYVSKIEASQRKVDVIQLQEFARIYKKKINFFIK